MINRDELRLPACAFGAGAAHLAVLALVLPILITLPAPGESMTPNLVAIPVEILAGAPASPPPAPTQPEVSPAPPEVAPAQPDAIGALLENVSTTPAPADVDTDAITGSLPELASVEPVPADAAPSDIVPDEIASVDVVLPPRPKRVRRDAQGNAIAAVPPAAKPVRRAAPKRARRRAVTAQSDAAPYHGPWDALLGKATVKPADKRWR